MWFKKAYHIVKMGIPHGHEVCLCTPHDAYQCCIMWYATNNGIYKVDEEMENIFIMKKAYVFHFV